MTDAERRDIELRERDRAGRPQWEPDEEGYMPAQYEYDQDGNKVYPAQFALGLNREQREQQGYRHNAQGNIIGLPPNWDRNKVLPAKAKTNNQTPTNAVGRLRAAIAGGLGKARKKFGPPPFPADEPPMPVDDWARGEYYRAMANKENNLGMLSLGGGALTGGITAALMNKYYNGDKVNDWLNKHLVSDPTTNYGRFMTRANKALSGALPGISTIAASLLGGLGTRFIANKLHKRYRAIPKPANSSELGDVAKQEWLNGGFDGTELPGGWYVPPVENSRGRLAPAYGVADPIPAPEKDSHGDYWNPQVKRGPLMRN